MLNLFKRKKDKPPKEAKIRTIKSLRFKKIIKIALWTLVVFCALGSARAFTLAAKVSAIPEQQQVSTEVRKVNFATSVGAQQFAQNFLINYFSWNKDNFQERADRLKPYLRKGIDEQAGLRFDGLTGNSSIEKTEIWKVSETGENTSEITFKVTHIIKTLNDQNEEQTSTPIEKWIEVPVITDSHTFLINGIPTYTSKPPVATIGPIENETEKSQVATPQIKNEMKNFLNTFYKQYSIGTLEELEYLTKDKTIRPLDSMIVFNELEDLLILEKTENGYLIKTKAIFTENQSQAQITQTHKMLISKETDNRWQIVKFN